MTQKADLTLINARSGHGGINGYRPKGTVI